MPWMVLKTEGSRSADDMWRPKEIRTWVVPETCRKNQPC
jgi:hypothetical protein